MKRVDLLRWLEEHVCALMREGGRHCVYVNRATGKAAAIPRHREVNEILARRICKDLELPAPN